MIRHVLLFRFKPETSTRDARAVLAGLAELPSSHPAMRRFGLGENISERDQTFTHVMSLEFDSREQLEAYLNGPHHEDFVHSQFLPHVANRAIGSYEVT